MGKRERERIAAAASPTNPAPVNPPAGAQIDHSFTLQLIMELQKSTGEVCSSVKSLQASMDRQETKIDRLEDKLSSISHKVYAAAAIVAFLTLASGFFINKAFDLVAKNISISVPPSATAPPPTKPKTP